MRYSAFIFALMFLFQGKNVSAQAGFDTLLNYGQIKQMIASGVAAKDLKKQAFGWYHFAYYTERQYGDSDSAFQYLVRSMYRFKKNGDTLEYQRVRSDMAEWLSRRNLVNQAISMQSQALYYAQKHGALGLRVRILARMSRYYLMKGDTVNALQYRRLFRLANELQKDTALEVSVLLEEVKRLHYEGRNTAAALLSARTLELARRLPQTELLAQSLYNSGALACDDRRYTEALKFLKEAEKLPVGPFNPQRRLILRQLSTTYAGLDSLNTALKYAFKYAELSDSILYRNRDTAAQRIVMQFDTLETSKTISLLKREKNAIQSFSENLFLVLEVLFFLILIAGLAFYLYRRDNLKQKLITRQQEEIKTRKIRELEDALKIETMQSMLDGQESERQRVAQDLHDSLGGLLAAARMQLEGLAGRSELLQEDKDLLKIKGLLDETMDETRHIARNLQPGTLLQFGLVKAVQDLINRVKAKGGPDIDFEHFGEYGDLSQHVALHCYRIVQELLQNCLKHAKAHEILVQLTRTEQQIALLVEDDGVGYDPASAKQGMGTGNIAQRVHFLKGEISVQSTPGKGASTLVSVPCSPYQGKP